MPVYPVVSSPAVALSQAATGRALIVNQGPDTVYLDGQTSVSDGNHSTRLAPDQSVNWGGGELWAVTAAGESASVTVQLGGDTSISPRVHLSQPVNVQGGAVVLYSEELTLTPDENRVLTIDGPADGVTYYGVAVSTEILTSGAGSTIVDTHIYSKGFPGHSERQRTARIVDANEVDTFGYSEYAEWMLPFQSEYPLTIHVRNWHQTANATVFLHVVATSYALPYPVDLADRSEDNDYQSTRVNPAANNYVTAPASLTNRRMRLWTDTAGLTGVHLQRLDVDIFGVVAQTIVAPHIQVNPNLRYPAAPATDTFSVSEFFIPGDGQIYQVEFFNAFAGTVYLSLMEMTR